MAWQPVRTAPIVLAGGVFATADHRVVSAGDHLDPLVIIIGGLVLLVVGFGVWQSVSRFGLKKTLEGMARVVLGVPPHVDLARRVAPADRLSVRGTALSALGRFGDSSAQGRRRVGPWSRPASLFTAKVRDTHGTAHFGTARDAVRHLVPAAPADGFVLGVLRDAPRGADRRFRQDGHLLTCAPTGAGKGIGAVIPNLLDYPGSAFVLDFKGETYAVTARARRGVDHDVILIDPFGITGATTHRLNWLDTLDPDDPDVVSRAAGIADMLVVAEGADSESHWNDTARELLRGLLVYVAGLPVERRSMAELRRIVTAPEDDLADTLADMLSDSERGHRLPARTAAVHLNRPERERGSVLSSVVRHTAWLDDPRLCAALGRSDFSMADLKRRKMTVYLAIPPDRLRVCLGFVRGFIGLALDGITAVPARPIHRVGFFLD
jgi:type IV secretion system protein VirD4